MDSDDVREKMFLKSKNSMIGEQLTLQRFSYYKSLLGVEFKSTRDRLTRRTRISIGDNSLPPVATDIRFKTLSMLSLDQRLIVFRYSLFFIPYFKNLGSKWRIDGLQPLRYSRTSSAPISSVDFGRLISDASDETLFDRERVTIDVVIEGWKRDFVRAVAVWFDVEIDVDPEGDSEPSSATFAIFVGTVTDFVLSDLIGQLVRSSWALCFYTDIILDT